MTEQRSGDPREQLIVALDASDATAALALADRLGDAVLWFKVGLALFTAAGPPVVTALVKRGKRVFLDLKVHDIPNTAAGAVRSAAILGVDFFTLHAEGGPAMLQAARRARDESGRTDLRLLAVTVLTSLHGDEYPGVYRDADVPARVRALAGGAVEAGVDGVVASARDLAALRGNVPSGFLRVTPGIRPAGSPAQDQARVATPEAALRAGATHLVVGRAITAAQDPAAAAREILEEMARAGDEEARSAPGL